MQGKMSEKKIMQGKTQRKKFMHKMGRILILHQNYNSSLKVFHYEPNGIRACLMPQAMYLIKQSRPFFNAFNSKLRKKQIFSKT